MSSRNEVRDPRWFGISTLKGDAEKFGTLVRHNKELSNDLARKNMTITRTEKRGIIPYLGNENLEYQQHQRDYSLLGSTAVARGLFHENKKFFGVSPNPIFLVIKDGIFYHFMAKRDGMDRCRSWLRHQGLKKFTSIESTYDRKLKRFRRFSQEKHPNLKYAFAVLYRYYVDFTNIIFLGYEMPEFEKKELSTARFRSFFSIRRKYEEMHRQCLEIEKKLVAALEDECGVKSKQLLLLTVSELERFLKNHTLPDEMDKRSRFFVVRYDQQGEQHYTNAKLWQYFRNEAIGDKKRLQGSPAYGGMVTGKVRIIKKVAESSLLKKGEILVTGMTDPRYLPAMKRSLAIVTDEGGITCHAAIVSREYRIPCIVGTQCGTNLLQTGDVIQVDANEGTVMVVQRASRKKGA